MNSSIFLIIIILLVLYNLKGHFLDIYNDSPKYKLGIISNNEIVSFADNYINYVNSNDINNNFELIGYDSSKSLIDDLNNGKIDFAINYEDSVVNSCLGLNNNDKLDNIQFICGLYFNYIYFMVDVFYNNIDRTAYIKNIEELGNFYDIYKRNIIIGTEKEGTVSYNHLMKLLRIYGYAPKIIDKTNLKNSSNESNSNSIPNSETKTIYIYIASTTDKLYELYGNNYIDGIFVIKNHNDRNIFEIIDNKDVNFIGIPDKQNILQNIFSYYDKTLVLYSKDEESLVNQYMVETKGIRIVLVSNRNTPREINYDLIKTYFTNNTFLINRLLYNKYSVKPHYLFKPIDMVYINKYIPISGGAKQYMQELGFIRNNNPKTNKFNIYWKYDKIGLNKFILS